MTTRSEREKAQRQNEEHQTILADLLRQEANKYCADCEAKGPRWASWNLGVFLCIRCAGIHRNLGVHISRVKSVNLDQWTQQQIQNMQELGNARAPQIYEGRLPPDFKRPQSDHAVEMFVRDKYEKKKYMDKNVDLNVLKQREKLKEKKNEVKPAVVEKARVEKSPEQQGMHKAVRAKTPGLDMDLLGLDAQGWNESPKCTPTGASGDLDIFGPMVSNPLPASTPTSQATVTTAAKPVNQGQSSANDLNLFLDASTQSEDNSKKTMSKDSILSLYGNQHGQCVPQGPVYLPPGASIAYMPSTAAPMTYPSVPVNAPQNAMMGVAPVGVPGATVRLPVGGSMSNGLMGNQLGLGTSAFAAGTASGTLGQSGLLGYTSISNVPTWNMTQVSQQMTGLSVGMPGGMGAYSAPQNMSSWATSPQTNQALSTHVWK